jgi:hypothetical protein
MHHSAMSHLLRCAGYIAFLLLPLSCPAQVTIGQIEVEDSGRPGIHVAVKDVRIKGYPRRLVTFAVSITDAAGEKVVFEYHQLETSEDPEEWESLVFDFSEGMLRNRFGEGTHDLFAVFTAQVVEQGISNLVPGGYHARPIHIVISAESPAGSARVDANTHLAALSSLDPVCNRAIEASSAYGITFNIREYEPSSSTIRRQYDWRNLEDSNNTDLIRSLEAVLGSLSALPVDFVGKTGLQSVAFVGEVYFLGLDVNSSRKSTCRMRFSTNTCI